MATIASSTSKYPALWRGFVEEHCMKDFSVGLQDLLDAYWEHTGDKETTDEQFMSCMYNLQKDDLKKWPRKKDGSLDLVGLRIDGLCLKVQRPAMLAGLKQLCLRVYDDPIQAYRQMMGIYPEDEDFLQAAKQRMQIRQENKEDRSIQLRQLVKAYKEAHLMKHGTDVCPESVARMRAYYEWEMYCCPSAQAYARMMATQWHAIASMHEEDADPHTRKQLLQSTFEATATRLHKSSHSQQEQVVLMQGDQELWRESRTVPPMHSGILERNALKSIMLRELQRRGLRKGEDGVHVLWRSVCRPDDPMSLYQEASLQFREG